MGSLIDRSARRAASAIALFVVGVAACGLRAGAQAAASTAAPNAVMVATFDSAWSMIRQSQEDRGVRGVDWLAVRDTLRPRAAHARGDAELRSVIALMVGLAHESHFSLVPRELNPPPADAAAGGSTGPAAMDRGGDAGIELRFVEGRLMVIAVATGGPADRLGVRPGWSIDSINGRAMAPSLHAVAALADGPDGRTASLEALVSAIGSLRGAPGAPVRVAFRDGRDASAVLSLTRAPMPGTPVQFGNLPTMLVQLTHARLAVAGGCVGVIRFNLWMVPVMQPLEAAIDSLSECAGIVLDLRGNVGGVAGMVMGAAGYFVPDARLLGTLSNRGGELRFIANPRRTTSTGRSVEPYAGRLAILIDELSVSTTEIFAVAMQTTGRARLFGARSPGQALPAALTRLPNGDLLMHVIADFIAPDGTRIEGRGAIPDEVVPVTRRDLLAGRDAAMGAAVGWLSRAK
jgi:carboxyl-terminal processing protease